MIEIVETTVRVRYTPHTGVIEIYRVTEKGDDKVWEGTSKLFLELRGALNTLNEIAGFDKPRTIAACSFLDEKEQGAEEQGYEESWERI